MNKQVHELTAADGHRIFTRSLVPSDPRVLLLLFHGLHEHSGYYGAAMDSLGEAGIAVFAADHRGHGYSGGVPGDVGSNEAVLEDAARVQAEARGIVPDVPLFLWGHSYGGQLALLYALRHQKELSGVVLLAPLVLVPAYISPMTVRVARLLGKLLPRLPMQPLGYDRTSRDPRVIAQLESDPLYYKGGIRARTGNAMLDGMQEATRRMEELELPLLVLHGEKDETVELACSRAVTERAAGSDKTLKLFPEAMHHLILEPEGPEVLKLIGDWILERIP